MYHSFYKKNSKLLKIVIVIHAFAKNKSFKIVIKSSHFDACRVEPDSRFFGAIPCYKVTVSMHRDSSDNDV